MELSGNTLSIVVVLIVAGFLIGNFMGAKPKAREVRTADLRLLARKIRLYPKLVQSPDWLPQTAKMTPQYTLVVDEFSLPMACYVAKDGVWQAVGDLPKKAQVLAGQPLELPAMVGELVLGLQIKANSVMIFWKDDQYQQRKDAQKLDEQQALQDLNALKSAMQQWGEMVQSH